MSKNGLGKKSWIIPDCELPLPGEGVLKGHESVIVVNDSDVRADIEVKIFYVDKDCDAKIRWTVEPGRVRCFRMNNVNDMDGYQIPVDTQYAMKVTSNTPIVLQYGRLDNRQTNLAYYTTLGYAE